MPYRDVWEVFKNMMDYIEFFGMGTPQRLLKKSVNEWLGESHELSRRSDKVKREYIRELKRVFQILLNHQPLEVLGTVNVIVDEVCGEGTWIKYLERIKRFEKSREEKEKIKFTTMKHSDPSAGISSFYSRAEAVVGETFDLSAKAQGTVTYTSSNPNVATVTNDGKVTANKAGTTTVTVTSTGAYGDKITAKCNLTVSKKPVKSSYIPIVTNMKIEGKGTADSDPVVTKVYWYIKNDTQNDAVYSLGDMQISL